MTGSPCIDSVVYPGVVHCTVTVESAYTGNCSVELSLERDENPEQTSDGVDTVTPLVVI